MRDAWPRPAGPPNAADNPGLALGAAMGEAALAGRDKLTILTSPRLAAFGDWAEQLVAESTGKAGRGIVPVVGEPIGRSGSLRRRSVLRVRRPSPASRRGELGELAGQLMEAGHHGRHIELADPLDVGAEFVRWEIATAAAGIVLGIDPFDQPNVQESKDATKELLEAFRTTGALPQPDAARERARASRRPPTRRRSATPRSASTAPCASS